MRERIRAAEDVHGHVVRAERQLAGSGTRGRSWSSERGGSYQTLALRDVEGNGDIARPLGAPGVSVAVGIGLAAVLTEHGARVRVKWPNDLYYRGKKLGGILCESYRGFLLVGVGLNVDNEPPPGGVALAGWDLGATHELVLSGVVAGLRLWTDGAELGPRFAAFDWLAGREVAVLAGGRQIEGEARGVADDGALRVGSETIRDGTVARVDDRSRC